MEPDRFRRIEELYHSASELLPSGREAFLNEVCAGDAELLRLVMALLAQDLSAGPMAHPVMSVAADLLVDSEARWTPGTRVGPYRIVSRLGEGGMGEVFQALDTRLGREVAIKRAHAEFSGRFEREARAISALNHPNVCSLYDIGPNYLVMELVQGASLVGPVSVDTAIGYARQVAAGLEAAHDRGIVHRDLKPANLKITPEGTVKILDFGLAKATEAPESAGMTEPGIVLGTAAYMSPEQARGQTVDRRADIWAFGVVFYELLTGSSLFGAGSPSDSLAAVLTREPDFNALPADTPPRVRRLLELCLRKDPKQRLRDIGDARLLLDEPAPGTPASARPGHGWSVAAVLGIALLASIGAWLLPKPGVPAPGSARFLLQWPPGTRSDANIMATHAVPSPDGRHLVIVISDSSSGKTNLWVRPLDSTSPRRLDKTEGATIPFWSPDSHHIAFFAENKLKRVALSGGTVQTICDVTRTSDGGTWNQDGVIVFANYGSGAPPLMRVSAAGGLPTPVTIPQPGELWHSWPQFLPDGRHLLYFAVNKEPVDGAVYVQELGSTKRVLVMKNSSRGAWGPPGYLLFVRDGTLLVQRMDAKTFQLQGDPMTLAQDVAYNERNGRHAVFASRNGVLVYRGITSRVRQLAWHDRAGKPLGTVGKPAEYLGPALSPDGKSVAVLVGPSGRIDAWVMDLSSGVMARMTRDSGLSVVSTPVWSKDSQRLAVSQVTNGIREVLVASGKVTLLATEPLGGAWDWSPDGKSLLFQQGPRLRQMFPSEGPRFQTIFEAPYVMSDFRFSPDGRYLAYQSNESGQAEVYAASFPKFAAKRKLSSNGGRFPVWVKGGREIVYRATDGTLMSVEIGAGSTLAAGTPIPLFKPPGPDVGRFTVTADGNRFMLAEPVQKADCDKPDITVVLNWTADVR